MNLNKTKIFFAQLALLRDDESFLVCVQSECDYECRGMTTNSLRVAS
jgi:hypothetical protein